MQEERKSRCRICLQVDISNDSKFWHESIFFSLKQYVSWRLIHSLMLVMWVRLEHALMTMFLADKLCMDERLQKLSARDWRANAGEENFIA